MAAQQVLLGTGTQARGDGSRDRRANVTLSGDQVIRETPANRGTETSAEVLVGPPVITYTIRCFLSHLFHSCHTHLFQTLAIVDRVRCRSTISSGQGDNSGPAHGWTKVSRKSEATALQKAQNG